MARTLPALDADGRRKLLEKETGGEGGILKSRLISKSLQAKSLKSGSNLIVGIVAVTI
jgi:hypothetical protein